jgi:hypothetical protein
MSTPSERYVEADGLLGSSCVTQTTRVLRMPHASHCEATGNKRGVQCAALAAAGVAITAMNFEPLITALYSFGLFLGTVYSVPPLRLKQNAVAAFMIIACVRGFLLNFGVYHATRSAIGFAFAWAPSILFITCFVTLFAVVIAVTKDLPDIKGDREFGVRLPLSPLLSHPTPAPLARHARTFLFGRFFPHVPTSAHRALRTHHAPTSPSEHDNTHGLNGLATHLSA